MLWKLSAVIIFISGTVICSCKKNKKGDPEPTPVINLFGDGQLSPNLGKRLYVAGAENTKSYGNIWGRDLNEVFISGINQLVRVDLSTLKTEIIGSAGGLFAGKTHENNAAIFTGSVMGEIGYYSYKFDSNKVEKLLSLSKDQVTSINISGNGMFLATGIIGAPTNPCKTPWDFICSDASSVVSSSFYFEDRVTKQLILLPDKIFQTFSKDGTKALLWNLKGMKYIFDIGSKAITDSFSVPSFELIYYDDIIKGFDGIGLPVELKVLKNAQTKQVLDSFTPVNHFYNSNAKWSEDGTKLYYLTGNDKTVMINLYDLASRKEKTIVSINTSLTSPVSIDNDFLLSADNKRLLISSRGELYIKDVVQ